VTFRRSGRMIATLHAAERGVSGFTTYVPGDRSLMSRDIGLT
jgi:hypothetical protein